MKQTIRLTESELRGMISEAVNSAMAHRNKKMNIREDLEWDDNGYPTNLPEDVSEWAGKLQNLCSELVRLKGKYRLEGNWDTLLEQLDEIFDTLNGICADANTYGMSSHWSS